LNKSLRSSSDSHARRDNSAALRALTCAEVLRLLGSGRRIAAVFARLFAVELSGTDNGQMQKAQTHESQLHPDCNQLPLLGCHDGDLGLRRMKNQSARVALPAAACCLHPTCWSPGSLSLRRSPHGLQFIREACFYQYTPLVFRPLSSLNNRDLNDLIFDLTRINKEISFSFQTV